MLVVFGVVIVFIGLAFWSGFGASWLGRLPGDIRIERGQSAFYFPIVTCIIISVVLSLLAIQVTKLEHPGRKQVVVAADDREVSGVERERGGRGRDRGAREIDQLLPALGGRIAVGIAQVSADRFAIGARGEARAGRGLSRP